jgi:hypothetical protein
MSSEEASTEDSIDSLSEVSSLDGDFAGMHLESAISEDGTISPIDCYRHFITDEIINRIGGKRSKVKTSKSKISKRQNIERKNVERHNVEGKTTKSKRRKDKTSKVKKSKKKISKVQNVENFLICIEEKT